MVDELRRQLNVEVELEVASKMEIEKAYNRIYGIGGAVMQKLSQRD
jgi:hypothetical protein